MKGYYDVLDFDKPPEEAPRKTASGKTSSPKKAPSIKGRGCDFCPLNNVKGINKVMGLDRIQGKSIMIWAQNPGEDENRKKMELVGPAGKFLWEHGASVGLKREDCDIQNVVRCWTVDVDEDGLIPPVAREPAKAEIHCCSIYTEDALERNHYKAKVHLVLGKVAAKSLLKGEYRKDQKTFYSDRLKAWVVCTYHPSYFLRGAPRSKLVEFKDALRLTLSKAGQTRGRFTYIENQDYKPVSAAKLQEALIDPILASGERVAVDIEDAWIPGKDGKVGNLIICVGFSWEKGVSRVVFLDHPELKHTREEKDAKVLAIKEILENPKIRKAFQHGCYDVAKIRTLLNIKVKGFDHDTQLSEYLRFSGAKAYGLEAISDRRFREFAGYKNILEPYKDKETGIANLWLTPLKVILVYNGADVDLTKRIEKSNHDKIDTTLLRVMVRVSFPLARMEKAGPWYDSQHDELLQTFIPQRLELLKTRIVAMAKIDTFNPNATGQVAAMVYDKLGLGQYLDREWKKKNGERSTNKDTMQLLGTYHPFPLLVFEFRQLAKKVGTYMKGFRLSAELHGGRLRTNWWLTGTITCRLRSGGSKREKGVINLQNIHGDPAIENLLVSDLRWREVYKAWVTHQKNGSLTQSSQTSQT